ncbi:MAG: hypothetical protein BGO29_14150 [Bacteroidales bacterium 36-12]|nr:MAG: hypothetical protein BGO29_14150 [Bacteroidales bacterium 36-12]
MKTLLVSLISDQTLPNVQLIKEFKDEVDEYFFISTDRMEEKGCRKWIKKASLIDKPTHKIEVKEFSFDNINDQLDSFDFASYDRIIVNLTGGTKVMTLAAEDYFKQLGAEIFYITGINSEYIKVFPGRKKEVKVFTHSITLNEYLEAHGFTYYYTDISGIPLEYTINLYHKFNKDGFKDYHVALNTLRTHRSRGIKDLSKTEGEIITFIKHIDYTPQEANKLSPTEVKYLTGDWFEEYIGLIIKEQLSLDENTLQIGVVLNKEQPQIKKNSVNKIIGNEEFIKGGEPDNEIDIMFTYNNKFYTIECKTSIINYINTGVKDENGNDKFKEQNILGDTIYKADYLKNRFGLHVQSNIVTLTHIQNYIENSSNLGVQKNKTRSMEDLINRCNLSNIKLIDKSMLEHTTSLSNLII